MQYQYLRLHRGSRRSRNRTRDLTRGMPFPHSIVGASWGLEEDKEYCLIQYPYVQF
jgi:hypothetical protein